MGFRSVLILLIWVFGLMDVRGYRAFMITSHFIYVGEEPPLRLSAVPSFDFSHLILIDSTCGRPQGKCQRYCSDSLYCGDECQSLAPQMAAFICNFDGVSFRYNAKGTQPLDKWKWQVPGWRTMYGNAYSERALGNFNDAVFGYGPGPGNPLFQIAKARNLRPVFSIALNLWVYRGTNKRQRYYQPTTVGHLDMSRCVGWEFVKSLSPDRWVFPIEAVDFMGVGFGKAVGTFSYTQTAFLSVSSQVAEKLIAEGVAEFDNQNLLYQDTFRLAIPCDTSKAVMPPVSFKIGNIDLRFNETAAFRGLYYHGRLGCIMSMFVDHKSPHVNAEVWIFGTNFFREHCVAFDFDKMTIGFGKVRKWPFPYLSQNVTKYYQNSIWVGDFANYTRRIASLPSFEFAHLVVIDSSCGHHAAKCRRLCEDHIFTELYCDYKCQTLSPQMVAFFCNNDYSVNRYNGTISSTAERLGEWRWQTSGMRRMFGRQWSDGVELAAFPVRQNERTRIRMASAESFDSRVLQKSDSIMGLAPGADNPLRQMAEARNRPPIVSISHSFWAYRHRRIQRPITVGALDRARCAEWKFVKSLSPHRWTFQIDQMDFMGSKMGKSGMFSYTLSSFASMAAPIADQLLSAGVLKRTIERSDEPLDHFSALPCDFERNRLPAIKFQIGDVELVFNESATFAGYTDEVDRRCVLNIHVDHRSPHLNADVWVFGSGLFREYCLAFDYERLLIGFARLRKSPFPYLQDDVLALF